MSTLNVNYIEASTGTSILIPTGFNLSLAGNIMNAASIPPAPAGANANSFLYSDGTNASFTNGTGISSMQTFTSNATWTKPPGISKILVRLCGGGGGGSGHGETGGAGGYAEKIIDVTSITSVSITIGNGSVSGTYYSGNGGGGGTTSFGSFVSASGGNGANSSHQHCGGLGGLGSGGDLNLYGGGGSGHYNHQGTPGTSFFGGGSTGGWPNGGEFTHNNGFRASVGGGGMSGHQASYRGANGRDGVVIVWEYK
jgi:hypothetical protein